MEHDTHHNHSDMNEVDAAAHALLGCRVRDRGTGATGSVFSVTHYSSGAMPSLAVIGPELGEPGTPAVLAFDQVEAVTEDNQPSIEDPIEETPSTGTYPPANDPRFEDPVTEELEQPSAPDEVG